MKTAREQFYARVQQVAENRGWGRKAAEIFVRLTYRELHAEMEREQAGLKAMANERRGKRLIEAAERMEEAGEDFCNAWINTKETRRRQQQQQALVYRRMNET